MRLKKTRKPRTCHFCGTEICKGDLYGQKTERIRGEASQEERDAVAPAILIECFSVKRDVCSCCATEAV